LHLHKPTFLYKSYIILYFIVLILFYLIFWIFLILLILFNYSYFILLFYFIILFINIILYCYIIFLYLYQDCIYLIYTKWIWNTFFNTERFQPLRMRAWHVPIVPPSEVRQMEHVLNWSMEVTLTRREHLVAILVPVTRTYWSVLGMLQRATRINLQFLSHDKNWTQSNFCCAAEVLHHF